MTVTNIVEFLTHGYGLYIVNHLTYRTRPTWKGNIACKEKLCELYFNKAIGRAEIMFSMVRITNLNCLEGSKVPLSVTSNQNVRSDEAYVVATLPTQLKHPAMIYRSGQEEPKENFRRSRIELGMPRKAKVRGVRRLHSTAVICRKEASLFYLPESPLSGVEESRYTLTLKKLFANKQRVQNLSLIMSDPNFLISCWKRIRSNIGSNTKGLDNIAMGVIDKEWFAETCNSFRNGKFQFKPARRTYILKPNGKKRLLTMPSPRDKIVQEGMRFLLELIFEPTFSETSYGWRTNRGCSDALTYIKKKFGGTTWFVEGDIEQQFPTLDHRILVEMLNEKIDDQAFIDLIYKYIKVGYGETVKDVKAMPIGVVQGGLISPILANIYMTKFDQWIEDELIPVFRRGTRRKSNPKYNKMIHTHGKAMDKTIRSKLGDDPSFKRLVYVRYADDFLLGIIGNKKDCEELKIKIYEFFQNHLKLKLSLEKTKITHATKGAATFLGYRIYMPKVKSMAIAYNSNNKLTRRTERIVLDGPMDRIVKRLYENKFAKKNGTPTRNGRLIYMNLFDIVNYYAMVTRGIIEYYRLANNYGRIVARVEYILKYSCALTIASKMNLRTKRKVFRKYGKNLSVKGESGAIISFPKLKYSKPEKVFISKSW